MYLIKYNITNIKKTLSSSDDKFNPVTNLKVCDCSDVSVAPLSEASGLNTVAFKSRADKKPISPWFRSTVEPLSASVCCLGPLSRSFSTEPHSPRLRLSTRPSLLPLTQTHTGVCVLTHLQVHGVVQMHALVRSQKEGESERKAENCG